MTTCAEPILSLIRLRWLPHRLLKHQSLTTVLLSTPITQMIFFQSRRGYYCSVTVLSTFLAVMWCLHFFVVVLQYSEHPNVPLQHTASMIGYTDQKSTSCQCQWHKHNVKVLLISGVLHLSMETLLEGGGVQANGGDLTAKTIFRLIEYLCSSVQTSDFLHCYFYGSDVYM